MGAHRLIRGGRSRRPPRNHITRSRSEDRSQRAKTIDLVALIVAALGLPASWMTLEAARMTRNTAETNQRATKKRHERTN